MRLDPRRIRLDIVAERRTQRKTFRKPQQQEQTEKRERDKIPDGASTPFPSDSRLFPLGTRRNDRVKLRRMLVANQKARRGPEKGSPAQDSRVLAEELGRFFQRYGGPDGIQESDFAPIDPQIKNLSLPLATGIAKSAQGTVLDIGCGRGVILRRLAELEAFVQRPRWIYVGSDFEENTRVVLNLAVDLKLHRRVDAVSLEDLYTHWVPSDVAPPPLVIVVRNVFHELSIVDTARLVVTLVNRLTAEDVLLVQDLQVFPVAERGNACWHPHFFVNMLQQCGFNCTSVEEPSASGNRWFTVYATRPRSEKLTYEQVRDLVIAQRTKQYNHWKELGALAHNDAQFRTHEIALLDFDLQIAALQQQLLAVQSPGVAPPTAEAEHTIALATFQKHLTAYDRGNLASSATRMERSAHFRDRANSQDGLEEYLRGTTQIALIQGGPYMGKTVVVREVLSRRAHDRCPVMLDVRQTSSVWNIVEQYLAEIGCMFPADLLATFRALRFSGVSPAITQLVNEIAGNTVVVFDHFEQLLEPDGTVSDAEVRQFLDILYSPPSAKVILTSRRSPDLGRLPPGVGINSAQPPVNRFPEGKHVENVLDDFVDRARLGIAAYPPSLLEAIDRYPYLAVLAAKIIQQEGAGALTDDSLLDSIRHRLRDDLLRRIVTPDAQLAIDLLSLVRLPIPRVMFDSLAGKESVHAAEQLGLLYPVRDRSSVELLTGAAMLRGHVSELDEQAENPSDTAENTALARRHMQISNWYARLYRESSDPRWLRELHYHTLAAGDESMIGQFGATYKAELFWAGNYWFRVRRNYPAALAAFLAAKQFGLDGYDQSMRIAACLMRVGQRVKAEKEYSELIGKYPNARGLKTSYIDSLLYVRDFSQALAKLNEFGFKPTDDPWIAHEFGRSHMGLHQYQRAVQAFEVQIKLKPDSFGFVMLAQAYFRNGDLDQADRVLAAGMKRFPSNKSIRLAYATSLIRIGSQEGLARALPSLKELHEQYPTDGAILHQLIKLLCLLDRTNDASRLFASAGIDSSPERFKLPMQVEIDIGSKHWDTALSRLADASDSDEHLIGLKKKVFLRWARSETETDSQKAVARAGLAVSMHRDLYHNVPILVLSYKLARIADDAQAASEFVAAMAKINAALATRVSSESLAEQSWEE